MLKLSVSVIVVLLFIMPCAEAQTSYSIPLEPGRWSIRDIPVYIPSSPTEDYQLTVQALEIWNQSMVWFTQTYYPNDPVYSLVLSHNQNASVQVEFEATSKLDFGSWTAFGYATLLCNNGIIHSVLVSVATLHSNDFNLQTIVHEIGHVVGLEDTSEAQDLMWVGARMLEPSTLDLYAVHILALSIQPLSIASVTLPSSISYIAASTTALPEFDIALPIVVLSLLAAGLLVKVRQRKRKLVRPADEK